MHLLVEPRFARNMPSASGAGQGTDTGLPHSGCARAMVSRYGLWMMRWRAAGLSPVARFSVALALVLAVTAVALGGVSAYLIGRYVEDETVTFTHDAVAGHFGTVFQNSVFQRPLTQAELQTLEQSVVFHFSIYNVVATRFYAPDGTIVFSYDDSEIGRRLDLIENQSLGAALAGHRDGGLTFEHSIPSQGGPPFQ